MRDHIPGTMNSIENNVETEKPNDHATEDDKLSSESSSSMNNSPFRKIEFHLAEKPLNAILFTNIAGDAHSFQLLILNPTDSDDADNDLRRVVIIDPESGGAELDMENSSVKGIGAGLVNLGNTCFLNSVLQCLTYTQPLAEHLQSGKYHTSCQNEGFCAFCAVQKHVADALESSGERIRPLDLVINLPCISESFVISRQEDAHEYMVNLLESMHICCLPSTESPSANHTSLVHDIFGGRLRSQVKCMECNYCSDKFETFLDLSLEILRVTDIYEALEDFTTAEELDGGAEVYDCEQCKKKVKALKQLTIDQAPNVLTIHLKRFSSFLPGLKIKKKVHFYSTLDLEDFVTGPHDGDLSYSLYGVLVHAGQSTQSGHYYCYVRTSADVWFLLDDDEVKVCKKRDVFKEQAYMLFYCSNKKTSENTDGSIQVSGQTDISESCIDSCPMSKGKGQNEKDPSVLCEITSSTCNNICGEKGQDVADVMQVDTCSSRWSNVATVPSTSSFDGPQNQSVTMNDEKETLTKTMLIENKEPTAFVMRCSKLKMAIDEPVCVATVVPSSFVPPPQKQQSLINDLKEALSMLLLKKYEEKITCEDVKEPSAFVMRCIKLKMAIDEPVCVATVVPCTSVSPPQKQLSLMNDVKESLPTSLIKEHEKKITCENVSDSNAVMMCSKKPQMATKEPVCLATRVIDRWGMLGGDDSLKVAVTSSESSILPKKESFLIDHKVKVGADEKRHKKHLKVSSGVMKFCSNIHVGALLNQQRKKKRRNRNLHTHMPLIKKNLPVNGNKSGSNVMDTINDTTSVIRSVENEFNIVAERTSSVVTEPEGSKASTSLECKDNRFICSLLPFEDRSAPRCDQSESTLEMKETEEVLPGIGGYIGDKWDNEYERGKRKKVRDDSYTNFQGRNVFQDIANEAFKLHAAGKRKRRRNKRSKRSNSKQRRFRKR